MKICVSVKCPGIIREFLIARNKGSDILKVDYNDVFARRVLNLLEAPPENVNIPENITKDRINIEICYNATNIVKVNYNGLVAQNMIDLLESEQMIPAMRNKVEEEQFIKVEISYFQIGNVRHSSEFRNYLSEESQASIVEEWEKLFKEIFHNYVMGYCRGMSFKIPCQKRAIMRFCDEYNIPMDKVSHDTLKKSWDRSELKDENILLFTRARSEKNKKNS